MLLCAKYYINVILIQCSKLICFCFLPLTENKRKSDDQLENSFAKTKRIETKLICSDLIILGLPYKISESELRKYFENFGEILMLQIKMDNNGQSRGYGFVRFEKYESQVRVLAQKHVIDGRMCDVKIPNSKVNDNPNIYG